MDSATSLSRSQYRPVRPLSWRFYRNQLHHRHLPIGHNVVTGSIRSLTRRMRALHINIAFRGSGEKQIRFHPVPLPINVRIDAMRPLRFCPTAGSGNIVSSGSHPDVPSVVLLGQLPYPHVMPLGKSVERLLKHQVGWPFIHQQRRHGCPGRKGRLVGQ